MKKANPYIKVIMSVIISIMLFIFVCTVYGILYRASQETDFAFFLGYTTFINTEDNMAPDYKQNDFLMIHKEEYYPTHMIILYKYSDSYRLGEISRVAAGNIYVKDKTANEETIVENNDIIGTVSSNWGRLGSIVKILTSIPALIAIVGVTLVYFAVNREQ